MVKGVDSPLFLLYNGIKIKEGGIEMKMYARNEQNRSYPQDCLRPVDNFWLFVEFLYERGGRACLFKSFHIYT